MLSGGPSERKSMRSRVLEDVPVGAAAFGVIGGGPKDISSSTSITSSKSNDSRFRAGPRPPGRFLFGNPPDISMSEGLRPAGLPYDEVIAFPSDAFRRRLDCDWGVVLPSDPRR